MVQDELSSLMTRNLNLDNTVNHQPSPKLSPTPQPGAPAQITYISQHYHHSAHQRLPIPSVEEATRQEIQQHGIDSQTLLPIQIQLYQRVQPEHQRQLIMLWSILPLAQDSQGYARDLMNPERTSMEEEEGAAQIRYLRAAAGQLHTCDEHCHEAEPYMLHGLDPGSAELHHLELENDARLARLAEYRPALDPAYNRLSYGPPFGQSHEHYQRRSRQEMDQDQQMG